MSAQRKMLVLQGLAKEEVVIRGRAARSQISCVALNVETHAHMWRLLFVSFAMYHIYGLK